MKPLLKYCGNASFQDIIITANSQGDFLGFVFAKSKRQVNSNDVKRWLEEKPVTQQIVGVFVNPTLAEVGAVLKDVSLDIIQCHGEESPTFIKELKQLYSKPVWKVIHHSNKGIEMMKQYRGIVDGFVIDSRVGNERGGTGVQFDWQAIPLYQKEAEFQQVPYFIAGGINETTIEELLSYQPYGIDLASGIEQNGRKSEKIKEQFEKRLYK